MQNYKGNRKLQKVRGFNESSIVLSLRDGAESFYLRLLSKGAKLVKKKSPRGPKEENWNSGK